MNSLAIDFHFAVVGLLNAAEDFHQCAFARSVVANQCDGFSRLDLEIHALQGGEMPEGFLNAGGGKQCGHVATSRRMALRRSELMVI